MNAPLLSVESVSKKFCKTMRRSMLYGFSDIVRNLAGVSSKPEKLRKNEFWAVRDASFVLNRGETLGVIGPNGAGKSTLLKMLNGIFWPDQGKITVRGRVGALIEVGAGFHPLLSGRENIYVNGAILGMNRREIAAKFDPIVAFADIGDFLDTPVKNYSSGMFVRLGFAIAVHCDPEILLIDEVLAVGDEGFQRKCFDKIGELKKNGTATIIVSHNMHMISTFSDHALLINRGEADYFADPELGIKAYSQFFTKTGETDIEKICSGNDSIRFSYVETSLRELNPGDSFSFHLAYEANQDFPDIDIDTSIWTNNETRLYFQATNYAYGQRIDIDKGSGVLQVTFETIPLSQSFSKIILAIWSQKRKDLLFWWRIPVKFHKQPHANGRNFLNVSYRNVK